MVMCHELNNKYNPKEGWQTYLATDDFSFQFPTLYCFNFDFDGQQLFCRLSFKAVLFTPRRQFSKIYLQACWYWEHVFSYITFQTWKNVIQYVKPVYRVLKIFKRGDSQENSFPDIWVKWDGIKFTVILCLGQFLLPPTTHIFVYVQLFILQTN